MIIESSLTTFGQYCIFMCRVFTPPPVEGFRTRSCCKEISKLGLDSIPLTIVISIFIGAVICIQMQLNMTSPMMPAYSAGLATRDILLLEFSSAVLCLILSGKVAPT